MAEVSVETKKTAPRLLPDPIRSLRNELEQLFVGLRRFHRRGAVSS
jgi:hypothetical protein